MNLIPSVSFACRVFTFFIPAGEQIKESNRRGREDHSRVTLTPDVIMHILRLQRRQALAYVERRYNRGDIESDDEDQREALILGLSDNEESSSENGGNYSGCNIS